MRNLKINLFRTSQLIALFVLTATILSACSDKLEENPKSIAVEVFYNTPAEVEAATNAIYSPIRSSMAEYIATLEAHSDFMYGRGSWEPISQYQGFNDVNITRVQAFWNNFYVAIRNANLVIQNAPLGSAITQPDIDKYTAEAKFLRALTYFQLVRNWGAIPLRTEENMTVKDLPKSSEADVYALIVADLLDAEAKLPETQSQVGRPTKWAAKALLADVFLKLDRFADAAGKANEIIQSNRFSLVRIATKDDIQNNIFGPTIVTSTEEVFSLKFSRLAGEGNYILFISNHPSTGFFNFGGAYAIHGYNNNPNYVNWAAGDLRKALFNTINFGLGANTIVSGKYMDKSASGQRGAGNDQPIYRYAEVLLIYAEASARAENAVSTAAMEALNKVRRRAYGFNPATPSTVDYVASAYTPTAFVNLVTKENGYEFIFEGKRWLELKRNGRVNELIQAGKNRTVAQKHLLWPIPLSEINFNKALDPTTDQNPGY